VAKALLKHVIDLDVWSRDTIEGENVREKDSEVDAAIGRLVRLIPDIDPEAAAIKAFFNYRLPSDYNAARHEWLDIVEANHVLWNNISAPKKELIRSFLSVVNLEIVKRLRPSSKFDYSKAAIGNLFLTG